jgi:hypothetical protein
VNLYRCIITLHEGVTKVGGVRITLEMDAATGWDALTAFCCLVVDLGLDSKSDQSVVLRYDGAELGWTPVDDEIPWKDVVRG